MNAYFTASIVGKKHHVAKYRRIIEILESKGVDVIADHIFKVEEKDIQMQSKDARLAFHAKLESWINGCDIMVVESSFPSISVGYEISLAIQRNKPILILHSEGDPPSLLQYHEYERLICEHYTMDTLKPIIEDFLTFAGASADQRFTFYITSEIASHLSKVSRKNKVPKSVYLRRLIETDMKRPVSG